jgi:osmotically-inducible protein OsmY
VRETLNEEGGLIGIAVHKGVVQLTGKVGSLSHRRLAEVRAWWTGGCELVENHLKVEPPEKETDDELTDAVRMVLEMDPLVHAGQIYARARDGVVTLEGYVASKEEKKLAILDAWYVPGVHEVVDRLEARS